MSKTYYIICFVQDFKNEMRYKQVLFPAPNVIKYFGFYLCMEATIAGMYSDINFFRYLKYHVNEEVVIYLF